jgi:hypothetical protein
MLVLDISPKGKVLSQWESPRETTCKLSIVTSVELPLALKDKKRFCNPRGDSLEVK